MTKWVDCVHFGPLTHTVADSALFMDATVGYSPRDPNSLPHPGISYAETVAEAAASHRIAALADLPGGEGKDIAEGSPRLTLGIWWQLMRKDVMQADLQLMQTYSSCRSKGHADL